MFRLTNVPRANSGLEIKPHVEGETIYVLCGAKDSEWRDGKAVAMTDTYVGDHMFSKPDELRRMYANDLATAIRMARDVGYAQAMSDIRNLIGAKPDCR